MVDVEFLQQKLLSVFIRDVFHHDGRPSISFHIAEVYDICFAFLNRHRSPVSDGPVDQAHVVVVHLTGSGGDFEGEGVGGVVGFFGQHSYALGQKLVGGAFGRGGYFPIFLAVFRFGRDLVG